MKRSGLPLMQARWTLVRRCWTPRWEHSALKAYVCLPANSVPLSVSARPMRLTPSAQSSQYRRSTGAAAAMAASRAGANMPVPAG